MNGHAKKNRFKVGLVQQSCDDDPDANLSRSIVDIREAAAKGAELIALPELHRSRYFCQTEDPGLFDLAEPLNGPTTQQLGTVAKELGVILCGSIFERRTSGLYHNTAVILGPDGRIVGHYRKMHIPDDPGFSEKYYFTPGDTGFKPIQTDLCSVGNLVCWDQWFPEAARLMSLAGAELLLYPTAIGWASDEDATTRKKDLEAWVTIQRSHAIANGLPLIACNRTGIEPSANNPEQHIEFWGNSFICGPRGEILAQADTEEAILVAEIDLSQTETTRKIWPYLRDRRIDEYADLGKRFIDNDG